MCTTKCFILVLYFVLKIFGIQGQDCFLDISNDRLPVPFWNHTSYYELAIPLESTLLLKHGDQLALLCPGPRNYINLLQSNLTSISCVRDNKVKVFRNEVSFGDIRCIKTVKSEVKKTRKQCGNSMGLIYNIGYQVTTNHWVTLIEVCHVPESGSTIYTKHVIFGSALNNAKNIKYKSISDFSTAGLNDDVPASLAYSQNSQKAIFNKVFQSSTIADIYINRLSYLARSHLAANADFVLPSSRRSTYFYINAAPQWQSINTGTWKSIESTVRKLPYDRLTIITGTHGILAYLNADGTKVPVYLGLRNKLPVPKYFWKLVHEPRSRKAVVFVVINDPFMEDVDSEDVFCENICSNYSPAWNKISTGFVFCCEFNTFQRVVSTVPTLPVKGVLNF